MIIAVPSHVYRSVFTQMLPLVQPGMYFVSASKGIENETLMRMSEVIEDVVKPAFAPKVAVISGPTFAPEVARGEPTALVVASPRRGSATAPSTRIVAAAIPAVHESGSHRRGNRCRGQEHHCHCGRRGRRPRPGIQRHGGADHARPCRNHAARGRMRRQARNTIRPRRAWRSGADVVWKPEPESACRHRAWAG